MTRCPSQDWDRYAYEQDAAAEAQLRFMARNKKHLVAVCCAILRNPNVDPIKLAESDLVDMAKKIVSYIDVDDAE